MEEERKFGTQTAAIEVVQKEAQTALNEALPALHDAIRALDTINK